MTPVYYRDLQPLVPVMIYSDTVQDPWPSYGSHVPIYGVIN